MTKPRDLFPVPLEKVAEAAHAGLLAWDSEEIRELLGADIDHRAFMYSVISTGPDDPYQLDDAWQFFGLGVPDSWDGDPADYDPMEDPAAPDAVERAEEAVSAALDRAAARAGLPGRFYFGHGFDSGDYGLTYFVELDDL